MGVSLTMFAIAVLRIAWAESLWLDELHTSWSVSGAWQDVASRAAAGNQTPLYFWLVHFVAQTLGGPAEHQAEWILRLPSVVAWLLAIALVAWKLRSKISPDDSRGWLFAIGVVAWIALDRLQWFFASEARPYAFVQLMSLAGWCCVEAIVETWSRSDRESSLPIEKPGTVKLVVVWCVLAVTNIYLHLTAALPVLFQWLVVGGVLLRMHCEATARSGRWSQATLAAGAVGLALLPILQLAFPVWQRRGQWASFASDVSFYRATSMFPFVPVLLCVLIGYVVDRLWKTKDVAVPTAAASPIAIEVRWLWWTAMLGPWLVAWIVTSVGVAPILHQRFVFASAMPLFIVGGLELLRLRHWTMRWVTCLAVAVAIVFSQGSVWIWRAGYMVGNLRGEDWRAATQWVDEQLEPGEPVLCSSGLIEANANQTHPLNLPLDPEFAEYLAFPLLGIYHLSDSSGQVVPVTPLLGDHHQWAAQVMERMAGESNPTKRLWLVYRGAPGRLKTKLTEFKADLRIQNIELTASEPKRFGNLYVVELKQQSL